eukprot:Gb_07103 [translate_table: standard]
MFTKETKEVRGSSHKFKGISYCSILALAGNVNYYDVRKECIGGLCNDFSNIENYLNQRSVWDVLGVGDQKFISCVPLVYEAMLTDWMRNMEVGIPTLIEDSIKLLVYGGEYDLICKLIGNSRWVNSMEWSGHQNFTKAHTKPFLVDDGEVGLISSCRPLSFLKVHDAGHMVPMDKRKDALETTCQEVAKREKKYPKQLKYHGDVRRKTRKDC